MVKVFFRLRCLEGRGRGCLKNLLGITDLFHNGMILSTLNISSHGFALDFSKRPHMDGDILFINP